MDYKKFWAIIDHEKSIKEREGKTVMFTQNVRGSGKSGGWRKDEHIVIVEFVDSEKTLIRFPDQGRRIVNTAELTILTEG